MVVRSCRLKADVVEKDEREGRKPFTRGRFDKKDGHLIMYTRQTKILGHRDTLNIKVEMARVADEAAP